MLGFLEPLKNEAQCHCPALDQVAPPIALPRTLSFLLPSLILCFLMPDLLRLQVLDFVEDKFASATIGGISVVAGDVAAAVKVEGKEDVESERVETRGL